MAINFPSNPSVNQTYTYGNRTWKWNGNGWEAVSTTNAPSGGGGGFSVHPFSLIG